MSKKVLNDFDLPNEGDIIDRIANEQERVKRERLSITKASQIKQKSDFIALLRQFGIEVRKNGRSYMALCPFHKDTKPSLSIDPEKKLFHCFGCGISGDVIEFVKQYKGTDFHHALSILSELNRSAHTKPEDTPIPFLPASAGMTPSQPKTTIVPPPPLSQVKLHTLLKAVGEHYHKTLLTNQKAQEYLKRRGLMDAELINRFTIGYCDCTLPQRISDSQKEALRTAGIFTSSGTEHFRGCIVVPVFKENGQIGEMYGRSISGTKHLYLPGPHEGVFNHKAMKVYDEIILVESIIDALSLIRLRFENTIPLYGLNGYTEDHRKGLIENRIKKVIIAFDNDDAGRKGAESLKKLLPDEVSASFLFPPRGKDWNEELVMGAEREVLKKMMEEAEVYTPEKEQQSLEVKREGSTYRFTINEITYRLIGVKEVFVQDLRVNIKAQYGRESFYDKFDLYSARARSGYSTTLGELFGVEPKRIEKDMIQILEYLEEQREKVLGVAGEEKQEMSEEERELGERFCKSPDMFEQVVKDMEVLGYVGEEVNKQLIFLAAVSRLLPQPLSVYIQAGSSAGKSYLLETMRKLLPPEAVKALSSFSDQALNYLKQQEFFDKVFILGEAIHNDTVLAQIRQMQSENEISRLVTVKDEKTGEMVSKEIRHEVRLSFMTTSTALILHLENASRCLVLHGDESAEQTRRVLEKQRHKSSFEGYAEEKYLIPQIIKKHHAAQRLLQKLPVFNPFSSYMRYPEARISMRRSQKQFLVTIEAACTTRQMQKERVVRVEPYTGSEIEGIECDLEDYRRAYRLFVEGVLQQSFNDVPEGVEIVYEGIREMVRERGREEKLEPTQVTFIQKQVRELTKLGGVSVKRYLRMLVEYEYVEVLGGRRHGTRYCYRLREDKSIEEIDLSMIPTPEEMERRMEGEEGRSG